MSKSRFGPDPSTMTVGIDSLLQRTARRDSRERFILMTVEPIFIENPIRTTKELAKILGMSPEHAESIRRIMNTPVRRTKSAVAGKTVGTVSLKKSSSRNSAGRPAKKK